VRPLELLDPRDGVGRVVPGVGPVDRWRDQGSLMPRRAAAARARLRLIHTGVLLAGGRGAYERAAAARIGERVVSDEANGWPIASAFSLV
jgi:hypothetical protein